MKKIIAFACLLLMVAFKGYSQTGIVWNVKDDVSSPRHFAKATVFNLNVSGFTSKSESAKFFEEFKNSPDVASVQIINSDENGNSDVVLTMAAPKEKLFYLNMAQKLNVAYIKAGDDKKTPAELIKEDQKKK